MSKPRALCWGCGLTASLLALTMLATVPRAQALEPVETLLAGTTDLLDVATYQVRTVLKRPDGSTVERSTPAVVGVPALVDVHGTTLAVPDLSVAVTPLPDRIRLSITKLPTAPAALPVLVEAVFDVPGDDTRPDLGVGFGYDQQTTTAPRGFTTDLLFSIYAPPRDSFTMTITPSGAPPSLSVIGELFTRSGAARLDPKRGRLAVDPVPENMTFSAELESREARGERAKGNARTKTERDKTTVKVRTSRPVHAVVAAGELRGDFRRDVVADIRDLPTETAVSYTDETLEDSETRQRRRQLVEYSASSRIGQLDVDVDEFVAEVPQQSVHATATNLPRRFTADVTSDDGLRVLGPDGPEDTVFVEGRQVDYTATEPIDALTLTADRFTSGVLGQQVDARLTGIPHAFTLLNERHGRDDPATEEDERTLQLRFDAPGGAVGTVEAGVGNDQEVAYLTDPAQFFKPGEIAEGIIPSYAFKQDDDLAVRLVGLSEAFVDTADPLVVQAVSAGGRFLLRDCKPACSTLGTMPEEFRTVTANVLDLPADATITFSPDTHRVTYAGSAPIGELRAVVNSNPPLLKGATRAELRAVGIPTSLELAIDAGKNSPTDGSPSTLASFEAHGQRLGLLEVRFTSDPNDYETLPADADGVLLRDLREPEDGQSRFLLFGRITGLRSASVVRTDLLGTPEALRTQSFATTLSLNAPLDPGDTQELRVDVGRTVGGQQERLVLDLDNRPNTITDLTLSRERVALPFLNPDFVSLSRGQRLHYEADRRAGDLVACQRAGATLPAFDCEALVNDPAQVVSQLGLTARIDVVPRKVDLCLATDEGDLGRGHEGKSQNPQGEVEPDDPEEFAPLLPPVGCFTLPPSVDQADLCADDEGPGDPRLKLDCLDNPFDDPDLGRRLLVKTAMEFSASEPVTLNLFDCKELVTLDQGNGHTFTRCTEFTSLSNLRAQTLRAQLDSPVKSGDSGYAFLDTQNRPVSGDVLIKPALEDPGDTLVQLHLPGRADDDEEFSASERLVVFEAQITGADGSVDVFNAGTHGECDGPDGTDIEVKTVVEVKVLGAGLFDIVAPGLELFNDLC